MMSPAPNNCYSSVSLPRNGRKQRKQQQQQQINEKQLFQEQRQLSFHQLSFGEQESVDDCQRIQIQNQGNERMEEMEQQQQHQNHRERERGSSSHKKEGVNVEDRKEMDSNQRVRS